MVDGWSIPCHKQKLLPHLSELYSFSFPGMERGISILSAILFVVIGQAQDVAAKKAAVSRFHIGVQGSVDHAYRTLELNQRTGPSERIMESRNHAEEPRLGYTGTLFMGYEINARFGLEAGVGYALRGWQLDISKLTFGDQIESRIGFIYQTPNERKAIRRSFHYLDIPVRGTFTLGNGPFRSITTIGMTMNILLEATSAVVLDGLSATKVDGYRSINLSPTVSTGLACDLNSKQVFRLEPTLRYGLMDMRGNDPIGERLWSIGLALSYVRRL